MEDDSAVEIAAALDRSLELRKDPLPGRCRPAAEDYFSVERGAAAYDRIYREIRGRGSRL